MKKNRVIFYGVFAFIFTALSAMVVFASTLEDGWNVVNDRSVLNASLSDDALESVWAIESDNDSLGKWCLLKGSASGVGVCGSELAADAKAWVFSDGDFQLLEEDAEEEDVSPCTEDESEETLGDGSVVCNYDPQNSIYFPEGMNYLLGDLPGDGQTYSVAFWMKTHAQRYNTVFSSSVSTVMHEHPTSGISPDSNGAIGFSINESIHSATLLFSTESNVVVDNEWIHFLMVVDTPNQSIEVYKNGDLLPLRVENVVSNKNTAVGHYTVDAIGVLIGGRDNSFNYSGYLADFAYKAGVKLSPEDFFTDGHYVTPDVQKLDTLLEFETQDFGLNSVTNQSEWQQEGTINSYGP